MFYFRKEDDVGAGCISTIWWLCNWCSWDDGCFVPVDRVLGGSEEVMQEEWEQRREEVLLTLGEIIGGGWGLLAKLQVVCFQAIGC